MKLLYLFSILFITSCASLPKDYLINNKACNYNNPIFKITEQDIILNIINHKKRYSDKDTVLINDRNFKNQYWNLSNGYITNKQTNKQLNISKWIGFYKDGKIESVHFRYDNGDKKINQETYYDKQGNIRKVIDYEKGYNICWAEALEIIKKIAKRDIKKYKIDSFNLSRIDLNEFPNSNPEWIISMNGNEAYNEKDSKNYVIDGVTGKLNRTYTVRKIYDSIDE